MRRGDLSEPGRVGPVVRGSEETGPTRSGSLIVLFVSLLNVVAHADPPAYPNHREVMRYVDAAGQLQPVTAPEHWAVRRRHILEGMQQAMGPLPDRSNLPPLDVKMLATHEGEGYTRQTITFLAEGEDRVPAYLYVPSGGDVSIKRPAMLTLHQTHPLGKGDVDFEHGRQNRCYASELAQRGYVVLAPDYPSFGDYKDYDFTADAYVSGTMKGIFNHMRAVDLLTQRDEVDADRIGVIGHSLGGHNAIFLACFDTRVKVIVSSCGWTPFHDYYGGKIAGWTSARYMPRLRDVYGLDADRMPFDFYELIAALAPRPFFSNSPLHDSNFDVAGVRKAEAEARKVYALLGAPDALRVVYPDAQHDFPPPQRAEAYRFIDKALNVTPARSDVPQIP